MTKGFKAGLIGLIFIFTVVVMIGNWDKTARYLPAAALYLGVAALVTRKTAATLAQIDGEMAPLINNMKENLRILSSERDALKGNMSSLRNDFENNTELYRMLREMVKCVDAGELVAEFYTALRKKSDAFKSAIYSDFENLYLSDRNEGAIWKAVLSEHANLLAGQEVTKFSHTSLFKGDALIYHPVIFDDIAGYFIFRTAQESPDQFQAQVDPVLAHFALALRKVRLYAEVEKKSRKDGLTGLFLKRYFMERLDEEIVRSSRYGIPFALLMVDIDYFKQVNDGFGHLAGDLILKETANIFTENIARGDLAGRYGGDEFIVYLPHTGDKEAGEIAEKMRLKARERIFFFEGKKINVTLSIGISLYPVNADNAPALVGMADEALYTAKQKGRNRVIIAGGLET